MKKRTNISVSNDELTALEMGVKEWRCFFHQCNKVYYDNPEMEKQRKQYLKMLSCLLTKIKKAKQVCNLA